ncbi:MAG: DUF4357 domain-containing protein [Succinivibrio sp.]
MEQKAVQFITDRNGRRTHAVIPVEIYEQLIGLRELVKSQKPSATLELYTFSLRNISARGYPEGSRSKPYFVVVKDSQAVLMQVSSIPGHIDETREKLLGDGTLKLDPENNCFVFTRDLKFKSPSAAAAIVAGNVRNGLDVWINREGFSLKQSGFGVKNKIKTLKK